METNRKLLDIPVSQVEPNSYLDPYPGSDSTVWFCYHKLWSFLRDNSNSSRCKTFSKDARSLYLINEFHVVLRLFLSATEGSNPSQLVIWYTGLWKNFQSEQTKLKPNIWKNCKYVSVGISIKTTVLIKQQKRRIKIMSIKFEVESQHHSIPIREMPINEQQQQQGSSYILRYEKGEALTWNELKCEKHPLRVGIGWNRQESKCFWTMTSSLISAFIAPQVTNNFRDLESCQSLAASFFSPYSSVSRMNGIKWSKLSNYLPHPRSEMGSTM